VAKRRLDTLLAERGLYESRSRAAAAVIAGDVRVGGVPASKPGELVPDEADVAVAEPPPYVSRGGVKLANALDAFELDPGGRRALDVGASTGGFTDVLLQRGAARVIALDVGYGQLHPRIRNDPRVTVLERMNARGLTELPFRPDLVVCDVSFISVRLALPPALRLAAPGWQALVLVKPQFEAGPELVGRGGLVRDPDIHAAVIRQIADFFEDLGFGAVGVTRAPIAGRRAGNREYPLHVVRGAEAVLDDARIREVVGGG
jgi:23S rRNA (cytidine1920-2'-O)/16S rRNA (cytidine1409-2'-O)-methyltransferase